MRAFNHLIKRQKDKIFYIEPSEFDKSTPRELLSYALGATLYMPATRSGVSEELISGKHRGLTSLILCAEDAVDDLDVKRAEENLLATFNSLNQAVNQRKLSPEKLPLLFIRVHDIECFQRILGKSQELSLLCGFVFPKISSQNVREYFSTLQKSNQAHGCGFYGMPILETPRIMYKETRLDELLSIKSVLEEYRDLVLNVRIGATDFSSLYSLRREFDQTIYDLAVISDCIGDIVNIFSRNGKGYVISGPVWEYFSCGTRLLKPQLRQAAFVSEMGYRGLERRSHLIDRYIDGLIKETLLDKANGLTGKTIIHPSHISIVNALQVVTREEYEDARSILESEKKGVHKSAYNNKMNEPKPHTEWAKKIMKKSKIYGVLHEERNYTSLFAL